MPETTYSSVLLCSSFRRPCSMARRSFSSRRSKIFRSFEASRRVFLASSRRRFLSSMTDFCWRIPDDEMVEMIVDLSHLVDIDEAVKEDSWPSAGRPDTVFRYGQAGALQP
ncbi:MAG: hypothetical protein MZV70_16900 [Desulfobacterales bacterium]|nr:hypothetical protein [Desulfobacterales bacterium]